MPAMRRTLLAVLLTGGLAAAEDVVLLTNGQRLVGIIDTSVEARPGTVAIKTAEGILRVRSDLIARVEESYETRLAKVDRNDARALTDLAWWCHAKGMNSEAVALLRAALTLKDPPIEARGLYAELIDLQGRYEDALNLLADYRARGGTDPRLLSRLKELEDAKAAFERDQNAPIAQPKAPAVSDGLEARGWDSESTQWSNPVTAKTVTIEGKDGTNNVVEVAFQKGDKDKAAIKRNLRGQNLGDNSEVSLWLFNKEGVSVRLAVALKTGNYVFHESMPVQIPDKEGWHEVRFDLKTATWKAASSNWAHTASVNDLSDLKELQVLIYNNRGVEGTVLLDAIDFTKPKSL